MGVNSNDIFITKLYKIILYELIFLKIINNKNIPVENSLKFKKNLQKIIEFNNIDFSNKRYKNLYNIIKKIKIDMLCSQYNIMFDILIKDHETYFVNNIQDILYFNEYLSKCFYNFIDTYDFIKYKYLNILSVFISNLNIYHNDITNIIADLTNMIDKLTNMIDKLTNERDNIINMDNIHNLIISIKQIDSYDKKINEFNVIFINIKKYLMFLMNNYSQYMNYIIGDNSYLNSEFITSELSIFDDDNYSLSNINCKLFTFVVYYNISRISQIVYYNYDMQTKMSNIIKLISKITPLIINYDKKSEIIKNIHKYIDENYIFAIVYIKNNHPNSEQKSKYNLNYTFDINKIINCDKQQLNDVRKIDTQIQIDNDNAKQLKISNKRTKLIQTNIFNHTRNIEPIEHIEEPIQKHKLHVKVENYIHAIIRKNKNKDEYFNKLLRHYPNIMKTNNLLEETITEHIKYKKKKINKRIQSKLPLSLINDN